MIHDIQTLVGNHPSCTPVSIIMFFGKKLAQKVFDIIYLRVFIIVCKVGTY